MEDKKYLLFAGNTYYPQGGMHDLKYSAATIDECKKYFVENAEEISNGTYINNWCHIVDASNLNIVVTGELESVQSDVDLFSIVDWKDGDTSEEYDW